MRQLARKQLDRAQLLFSHGAISLNDLQVAEDAEQKAKVALQIASQLIKTLGGDIDKPNPVVNIYAPMDGTIVEQNVVNTGVVSQTNLFTIANLSTVLGSVQRLRKRLAQCAGWVTPQTSN